MLFKIAIKVWSIKGNAIFMGIRQEAKGHDSSITHFLKPIAPVDSRLRGHSRATVREPASRCWARRKPWWENELLVKPLSRYLPSHWGSDFGCWEFQWGGIGHLCIRYSTVMFKRERKITKTVSVSLGSTVKHRRLRGLGRDEQLPGWCDCGVTITLSPS